MKFRNRLAGALMFLGAASSFASAGTVSNIPIETMLASYHEANISDIATDESLRDKIRQRLVEIATDDDRIGVGGHTGVVTRRAISQFGDFVRVADNGELNPQDRHAINQIESRAEKGFYGPNSLYYVADLLSRLPGKHSEAELNRFRFQVFRMSGAQNLLGYVDKKIQAASFVSSADEESSAKSPSDLMGKRSVATENKVSNRSLQSKQNGSKDPVAPDFSKEQKGLFFMSLLLGMLAIVRRVVS